MLPITFIFYNNNHIDEYYRLFFIIKVIRIQKGNEIFDVGNLTKGIKDYYAIKSKERIKNDLDFAEDTINDNNKIEFFIKIGYYLKTLKLAVVIMTISYLVGIAWYIFCQLIYDI